MSIKIKLHIEVDAEYNQTCGRECPFLNELDSECILFNEELEETPLEDGHVWQDGVVPTVERCFKCWYSF